MSEIRWPLSIEPHEDELLSSFLVRASHRHGLAPYRFCAFQFPGVPIWNRDIDRSASDALLTMVATKAGLLSARVMQMTLRSSEARLGQGMSRGSSPWINRIGVYHRLRRGWGQQYCPDCLAERPVLRRAWRISFIVVCSRHERLLQDVCPHCDAPLAIHRQMLTLRLCHHCSRVLGRIAQDPNVSIGAELRAQSYFERALQGANIQIGGQSVCSEDLFHGARVLASLLATDIPSPRDPAGPHRPSLERARVQVRANVILHVAEMLIGWPQGFKKVASEQSLTQRSFITKSLPNWLRSTVEELPVGRAHQSSSRTRYSLRAELARVRRSDSDWRSKRAALLWRAATK